MCEGVDYEQFFLCMNRAIRSSVANGDESGSSRGHNVRCRAAGPCSGLFCCANSFYSFGHGGAFCFSPCHTTSLVSFNSCFLYAASAYTGLFKRNFYVKLLHALLKRRV